MSTRYQEEDGQLPSSSAIPVQVPSYEQSIVSVGDFARDITGNPGKRAKNYFISLFPIAQWIYRYNLTWLYADLIAGLTVGAVVVPQGMSYAKIATLPPQYGLYSSFVGVLFYCFFATSKDVSIGPVAVMSLEVSKVIEHVAKRAPQYADSPVAIAVNLAIMCGCIALGLGLLRLGFILEYISLPAVLGFMTGSAFTIAAGQVPSLMGISKLFNTRAATYEVIINTLKNLKHSKLDAAFGLIPLFLLFFFRWFFDWAGKRYPKYRVVCFYGSVLRNAFVIIFATLISWGVCRHHKKNHYPISILQTVPRGLQDVGYHPIDSDIVKNLAPELPVSVIVLLLEHIAISKSFGRINDYKINPNQELIAIGVTNTIGSFFNAYPATGSFSRSALKSKCGVRTPLAGIFTGALVLVAIYALTEAFYWIPNATLAAIIIHAVCDLIAPIQTTLRFWRTSPLECVIFIVAVVLAIFVSIEAGIYFSVAASLVFLLLRISFADGQFLGRVEYVQLNHAHVITTTNSNDQEEQDGDVDSEIKGSDAGSDTNATSGNAFSRYVRTLANTTDKLKQKQKQKQKENELQLKEGQGLEKDKIKPSVSVRSIAAPPRTTKKYIWVPLSHKNINPDVTILPPPKGVYVFRPSESFTYPSASQQVDRLIERIRKETRPGIDPGRRVKLGDRPWNDHGPRHRKFDPNFVDERPILRAVIYDFSMTPHVDLTGVQFLVDARQELNKYANREVEFHFVGVASPWARRAIMTGFFAKDAGFRPEQYMVELGSTGIDSRPLGQVNEENDSEDNGSIRPRDYRDEEERDTSSTLSDDGRYVPIVATNTPFFHLEIPDLEFSDD